MTNLFEIGVGFDDTRQTYCAIVRSVADNKVATVENQTLRVVMAKVTKLVRSKAKQVRAFPLPEEHRIISLADSRPPLVAATGEVLNGRH